MTVSDKMARLRTLCIERMFTTSSGHRVDSEPIWPSEILAILDEPVQACPYCVDPGVRETRACICLEPCGAPFCWWADNRHDRGLGAVPSGGATSGVQRGHPDSLRLDRLAAEQDAQWEQQRRDRRRARWLGWLPSWARRG